MRKILGQAKRAIIGYLDNRLENDDINTTVAPTVIGKSVQNKPINCYEIGNGKINVLIIGGIHGNEVGTVKFTSRLIAFINDHLPKNITLHIVPCLNPDGYTQAKAHPDYWNGGRIGRFNAHDVDMNRNFDTPSFSSRSVWSHGKNYSETTNVFCGDKPFSEPETQTIQKFITEKNIDLICVFHNAGADVTGTNNQISQELSHEFSKASRYRFISNEDWATLHQSGTFREWAELNSIPYLEIEGAKKWGSDWDRQFKGTVAMLKKAAQLLK